VKKTDFWHWTKGGRNLFHLNFCFILSGGGSIRPQGHQAFHCTKTFLGEIDMTNRKKVKISAIVFTLLALSSAHAAGSKKLIGLSLVGGAPRIGFSLSQNLTLETEFISDKLSDIDVPTVGKYLKNARGFILMGNYYFAEAFSNFYVGIHLGETTTHGSFVYSLLPGAGLTPAGTESVVGVQTGYSWIWESSLVLGVAARATSFNDSKKVIAYPMVQLGTVF
jgi:hypothetical protein